MKRLFRILFDAATALSLLLCVAVVALWVRSYWGEDHITWSTGVGGNVLRSENGDLVAFEYDWVDPATGQLQLLKFHPFFFIPHWAVASLSLVPSLVWLGARFRRRRPPRAGLCTACGYDLRATPDRCPECGTAPAAPES